MPEMTRDEMIEGLLHEITRTHCHLEDADRDLSVVAGDLDELLKALEPSTAQLLGPFARGLQDHLNDLEQFDEATRVTLMVSCGVKTGRFGHARDERRNHEMGPEIII